MAGCGPTRLSGNREEPGIAKLVAAIGRLVVRIGRRQNGPDGQDGAHHGQCQNEENSEKTGHFLWGENGY